MVLQGWSSERVIHMPTIEGGRIVMVLGSDSTVQKNKVSVFLLWWIQGLCNYLVEF